MKKLFIKKVIEYLSHSLDLTVYITVGWILLNWKNSVSSTIDLFRNTTVTERKKAITNLETDIGSIKNELLKINKLGNKREKSIIILEEKIKLLTSQINSDLVAIEVP